MKQPYEFQPIGIDIPSSHRLDTYLRVHLIKYRKAYSQ